MFASQPFPYNGIQNFEMDQNNYTFTREAFSNPEFTPSAMYTEAQSYPLGSPELRPAPSNYSTASGASAASSAMGSPHSIHGHIVPGSEWASHDLTMGPNIVGYDSFGQSEYNFAPPGTEDFASEFSAKRVGFVGECQNVFRSVARQHDSISSVSESMSPFSTIVPDFITPEHVLSPRSPVASRSMAAPVTPVGPVDSREECFKSPISVFSQSPFSPRRPSQASHFASVSSPVQAQDTRSPPMSAASQSSFTSESTAFSKYQYSPFFSQSSGIFVPPLESSCWFPLSALFSFFFLRPFRNFEEID